MFSWSTNLAILKAILTKNSPYYIQFYIVGRCNLMCRQCNIVETNSRIGEMSLDQIKEVAKNLKAAGAGIVLLTGGEPFLRDDLPEIVETFCRLGMNVRLQTAGTKVATEEKLRACYDAGARDINVSLDSLDHPTFDYINAVPGSSKNAINTMETISRVFRDKSAILSFGTVMSQFNYREIPAIVEFAKRIGWYVSLVPVHIAKPDLVKGFRSFDEQFMFQPGQYGELDRMIEEVVALKRGGAPIFDSEWFLNSSASFLKGNGPTWRHKGVCDSPNLYFAVRPNGDFTTCCDYSLQEAPKVYGDSFVRDLKSGALQNRKDVQDIIHNCSGCHYGSYPEVTLSVRDHQALVERIKLVLFSGPGKLAQAPVQSDFLAEVERVKARFPQIYPKTWMAEDLARRVDLWQDQGTRPELVKADRLVRKGQNRLRGVGPDVPIVAERR